MNKKRSVIFFALLLSCLFSAIYVIGFMMITPQSTITRLSMNQIGIYQNQDNANKVMESLTAMNLKQLSAGFTNHCCLFIVRRWCKD